MIMRLDWDDVQVRLSVILAFKRVVVNSLAVREKIASLRLRSSKRVFSKTTIWSRISAWRVQAYLQTCKWVLLKSQVPFLWTPKWWIHLLCRTGFSSWFSRNNRDSSCLDRLWYKRHSSITPAACLASKWCSQTTTLRWASSVNSPRVQWCNLSICSSRSSRWTSCRKICSTWQPTRTWTCLVCHSSLSRCPSVRPRTVSAPLCSSMVMGHLTI